MNFTITVSDGANEWNEDYNKPVADLAAARILSESMIARFNDTLRPGEKPRKLLDVKAGGTAAKPHRWQKTNLVTKIGRGLAFDEYKCLDCGITGRRHGVEGVAPDRKFRAKKYISCQPGESGG